MGEPEALLGLDLEQVPATRDDVEDPRNLEIHHPVSHPSSSWRWGVARLSLRAERAANILPAFDSGWTYFTLIVPS